MKARDSFVIILFGLSMIGARDCAWDGWSMGPVTMMPQPALPYCLTDPPLGCAAVCLSEGNTVTFTDACMGVDAGPREMQFETAVMNLAMQLIAQNGEACSQGDVNNGTVLTPCQVGLPPVEWPNQDHEVCTPAPGYCL